ncbi:MAG TPA: LysR family transcriptional regulator [Herminiimonas sp.]|nr:LysR family transcriptional regulator [Herminiimonas sp.]
MAFDERMLNGIGVLSAIIDSGSFAGAGEILDMTQSGVSRSVARLEARLGIRVFDRTTRSVTLTDEGRRFYEQIMPLLAGLEEAASSVAEGRTAVRGRLRVTVDPFFSRLVLGPQLGAFIERYPDLQLELITRHQLGDMIADGFDLAVRFGQPRSSTLVARKLFETRILTVAAPSYLKKHGRPLAPGDLTSHACVQFRDPETGRPFEWEFHKGRKKIVVPTSGQLMVNDAGTLHSICLAGLAVAQTMAFGVGPMLADGRLIDLFPDWPDERFPLYALYPSRHHLPAKTRAFLDFVSALKD